MIRKRSLKRAKQEREYAKLRFAYLNIFRLCQVCGCAYSSEVHHKKGRIGELLTDTRFFLAVCHTCHQKIELFPDWAKEKGYSLSRLTTLD